MHFGGHVLHFAGDISRFGEWAQRFAEHARTLAEALRILRKAFHILVKELNILQNALALWRGRSTHPLSPRQRRQSIHTRLQRREHPAIHLKQIVVNLLHFVVGCKSFGGAGHGLGGLHRVGVPASGSGG